MGAADYEGIAVSEWRTSKEMLEIVEVSEKTLAVWRGLGLPAVRRRDGTYRYPWPHCVAWVCRYKVRVVVRELRQELGRSGNGPIGRLPFQVAWHEHQLEMAEEDAEVEDQEDQEQSPYVRLGASKAARPGLDEPPREPRRRAGRFSFRQAEKEEK